MSMLFGMTINLASGEISDDPPTIEVTSPPLLINPVNWSREVNVAPPSTDK